MNNYAYYDSGTAQRVFPCRCGVTHTGERAVEEYAQHNCLHEGPLLCSHFPEQEGPHGEHCLQLICGDCGKVFSVQGLVDQAP